MRVISIPLFICGLILSSAAYADPIPAYVLDKDFAACMGGENPAQDIQRAEYCGCIRDSMRGWTLEQYAQLATQESAATHSPQQQPAQLQAIAQACIAKVLH